MKKPQILIPTLLTPNTTLTEDIKSIGHFAKHFGFTAPDQRFMANLASGVYREGFDRCFFFKKKWTGRFILETFCKPLFRVFEGIRVEDYPSTEIRPDSDYLGLCHDTVEPDQIWRTSGDKMSTTTTPFISLEERSLLEANLCLKEKLHFDYNANHNVWTRCPRSRNKSGHVASTNYDEKDATFYLQWFSSNFTDSNAGGREVIVVAL